MSKDPAFLFYPSDFLTGTMFMNNEQIGIYIRLLCSQHQHGGIIDKLSFNSLVGDNHLLKSKFIETETGFYNERLAEEMDKRNKKSNNMSSTAKDVWAKRKAEKIQLYNKSNTDVKNINTNVQKNNTNVIQPVNEDVNINEVIDKDINIPFEEFWNLYDKKVGAKEKCLGKWNKLTNAEREKIIYTLPQFLKTISDKKFQPHPETYLNQKRWNDEIDSKSIECNKKMVSFYSALGKFEALKTDAEIEAMKANEYFTITNIN